MTDEGEELEELIQKIIQLLEGKEIDVVLQAIGVVLTDLLSHLDEPDRLEFVHHLLLETETNRTFLFQPIPMEIS